MTDKNISAITRRKNTSTLFKIKFRVGELTAALCSCFTSTWLVFARSVTLAPLSISS